MSIAITHARAQTGHDEKAHRLSLIQEGIRFSALASPNCGIHITNVILRLEEKLDIPQFTRAWQQVLRRHPILKSALMGGGECVRVVRANPDIHIALDDWSNWSVEEQERQCTALCARNDIIPLSDAPLARWTLIRCGQNSFRLIWRFHELALDRPSAMLVLDEVFAFYDAYHFGFELELRRPPYYEDFVELLEAEFASRDARFWHELLASDAAVAPSPFTEANAELAHPFQVDDLVLKRSQTTRLKTFAQSIGVRMEILALAAWVLALRRVLSQDRFLLAVTASCRPTFGEGAEAIVGPMTNILPLPCHIKSDQPLQHWVNDLRLTYASIREHPFASLKRICEWSGRTLADFSAGFSYRRAPWDIDCQIPDAGWPERQIVAHYCSPTPLWLEVVNGERLALNVFSQAGKVSPGLVTALKTEVAAILSRFPETFEHSLAETLNAERLNTFGGNSLPVAPVISRVCAAESDELPPPNSRITFDT